MLLQDPRVALSCATELTATDILNVAIPKTVDDCAKECILLNIESGQLIEGDDQCKAFRV